MSTKRRNTMMWIFSLFTGITISLFWLRFYILEGYVPTISVMEIVYWNMETMYWNIELPFAVSRWVDIAIGPIGSITIIWLYAKTADEKGSDLKFNMLIGLIVGLVIGLLIDLSALKIGLTIPDLIFALGLELAGNIMIIMIFDLKSSLIFAQAYATSLGLTLALFLGLPYGLAIGLTLGLVATTLIAGFKPSLNWLKNYLLVKDQD